MSEDYEAWIVWACDTIVGKFGGQVFEVYGLLKVFLIRQCYTNYTLINVVFLLVS